MIALLFGVMVVSAAPARADSRYFPNTGKTLYDPFLTYWDNTGQEKAFGYPITDAADEVSPTDGARYLTQWFERTRFELHIVNGQPQIVLGTLGSELRAEAIKSDPDFRPTTPLRDPDYAEADQRFFDETGHNLRFQFLAYWQAHDGLNRYGRPISEEHLEFDPETGKGYVMQWFERARFELHPENQGDDQVLLGLLGNELKVRGVRFASAWKVGQRARFLNNPVASVTDAKGNIYVLDRGTGRLNKYSPKYALINAWYLNGAPQALAAPPRKSDPNGSPLAKDAVVLYVLSLNRNDLRALRDDGAWQTIPLFDAGDSDARSPNQALAVAGSGTIYVLKYASYATSTLVWAYDAKGQVVGKYVARSDVTDPVAIAVGDSNLYVADGAGKRVLEVPVGGGSSTKIRAIPLPSTANALAGNAESVTVDTQGTIYVGEPGRISVFDKFGASGNPIGSPGSAIGQFSVPAGLSTDAAGTLYIADPINHRIVLFDRTGSPQPPIQDEIQPEASQLRATSAVVVSEGANPQIYAADPATRRIAVFNPNGTYVRGQSVTGASALAIAPDGTLYSLNSKDGTITSYAADGRPGASWGSTGMGQGAFLLPPGLALDDIGAVYVADPGNARIQKFDGRGTFVRQWGTKGNAPGQFGSPHLSAGLRGPTSIAFERATRTLYVVDPTNARIHKYDPDGNLRGTITSLEGGHPFEPVAVAALPVAEGGMLVLCADRLYRLDKNGAISAQLNASAPMRDINGGDSGVGNIISLIALAAGTEGTVYAADTQGRLQKFYVR